MGNHDMNRLPKWAQSHIRHLEMRLQEARGELDRVKGGKPTRIIVNHGGLKDDPDYYAKEASAVRFFLGKGTWDGGDWQNYIDVNLERHPRYGRQVLIRSGLPVLRVLPQSGNVVTIKGQES